MRYPKAILRNRKYIFDYHNPRLKIESLESLVSESRKELFNLTDKIDKERTANNHTLSRYKVRMLKLHM